MISITSKTTTNLINNDTINFTFNQPVDVLETPNVFDSFDNQFPDLKVSPQENTQIGSSIALRE